MDKFQSELLAQFKEHNRLTKELVKIERAAYDTQKGFNTEIFSAVKQRPAHWISSGRAAVDGTKHYMCSSCGWSISLTNDMYWRHCPNCGMPMEIEKEGEENA